MTVQAPASFPNPYSPTTPAWVRIANWIFFLVIGLGVIAFATYLFRFRQTIALYGPFLLRATITTILISICSMILAVLLGALGAWGKLSGRNIPQAIATVYVEFIRGTPTLVQMLIWGFGVGGLLSQLGFDPRQIAFNVMTLLQSNSLVSPLFNFIFYGIIGLGFNYGAYLTEVFRSGITTIDKGQTEAGLSLGMTGRQTMGRIIIPQGLALIIPPFTNNFITLIQDCALLSVIGVPELQNMTNSFANPITNGDTKLFVYVLGALFYLSLCYPLSLLARYLERRMSQGLA
ncbi:amino acid ABC transporter permease [Thermosynechococcaceae cyanobacterium BACA0444]|uniref:Amino acid ABC transporter permease n=1 Tax=Pseudocalidococcus azoricus BACA0444 TaxID=2918990 RepID=A0AAE4FQJ0_9CYAN|nr:amino acid ABC transporter permease [Pseudocalidococcus azoricus]MDS3859838.1 amino acid ABC transporter permease [Pseudocalidococcus azoricus BACA0444]